MSNNSTLVVIADNSGSMGEVAKPHILKEMLNYIIDAKIIDNYLSFNKVKVYSVNNRVESLNANSNFSKLKFRNNFDINEAIKLLSTKIDNCNRVLILSDWKYTNSDKKKFINFAKTQNAYSIRVVLIEIGLCIEDVNKINSKNFFHPQDIQRALHPWPI